MIDMGAIYDRDWGGGYYRGFTPPRPKPEEFLKDIPLKPVVPVKPFEPLDLPSTPEPTKGCEGGYRQVIGGADCANGFHPETINDRLWCCPDKKRPPPPPPGPGPTPPAPPGTPTTPTTPGIPTEPAFTPSFGGRMEAAGLPVPWQWPVTGETLGRVALGERDIAAPEIWGQGADVIASLLRGEKDIGIPDIWRQAAGPLGKMMQTGMPTDVSGMFGAMEPIAQRYLEETGKGMAEQFGLGGMRYSTPFQTRLMEETGRMGENMALAQVQAQMASEEAARARMMGGLGLGYQYGAGEVGVEAGNLARMMSGLGLGYQYGAGEAGLQGENLARQMQAASTIWGQGMGEVMYPMSVAQGMAGLGQGLFGQQSAQISQMLNDPYLMAMLGMAGGTGFTPQQYQPSPFGTGLDVFSSLLPWLTQSLAQTGGSSMWT